MDGPLPPPMFSTATHAVRELPPQALPRLQAFFEANPDYFLTIGGQPPRADEAQQEYDEAPPAELGFTRRWFAGVFAGGGDTLDGVLIVVSDLCAPTVWHVALFIVATRLHGQGVAAQVFDALQAWAREQGACWLRLGVVAGNTRAERFWQRQGFVQTRVRDGVPAGERVNTVRVLVKPLAGGRLDEYLSIVPRDRDGSTLP